MYPCAKQRDRASGQFLTRKNHQPPTMKHGEIKEGVTYSGNAWPPIRTIIKIQRFEEEGAKPVVLYEYAGRKGPATMTLAGFASWAKSVYNP